VLSKDKDFQQLCALRGAPPKVVWLRIGNRSTQYVAELLRQNVQALREFAQDAKTSLLIIAASYGS